MKAKDLDRAVELLKMLGNLQGELRSAKDISNEAYRTSVYVNHGREKQIHFHTDVWMDALNSEIEVIKAELDNLGVEVEEAA